MFKISIVHLPIPFYNSFICVLLQKPPIRGAANPPLNSMPAVMSPTQEYPVTSQVAPNYGRNPGDVSADLLVFNFYYKCWFFCIVYSCIFSFRPEKLNLIVGKLN